MKLRNKKTGEIKELQEIMHDAFIEHNEKSLMNLEKDWEDYEEPDGWGVTINLNMEVKNERNKV